MKLSKKSMNSAFVRAVVRRANAVVDERREHDRLAVLLLGGDAREAFLGFLAAVDERKRHLIELDPFELRKQAVPEHLRRDAGAIGDEEHGAALRHGG